MANWYNTSTTLASPSSINFLIFGAAWSFISLVCIEVLPRFLPRSTHPLLPNPFLAYPLTHPPCSVPKPYIAAPFDITNTLFYFSGFVSLAVFLQGLLFCRGDVCHAAQADVAFGAFSFLMWGASATLTALDVLKTRRQGGGSGGRPRAGTGAMPGMKEASA